MRRLGLLLLLFIAAIGGFSAWLDHQISRLYRGYSGSSIFVDIPRGTSRWHVAEILRENGVIPNAVAFDLLSRWHLNRSLQAGEYLFDHSMNEREVFWKIAGGHIYVHSVQITEGWTMFEIADALEREGLANREDFLKVARDPTPIQDLDPGAKSLEGFLFPSTYEFTRRATPQQIADAMVRHFRTVWASLNPDPANPAATTQQIVTIASLVERETPVASERPLVAGVFYNRLSKKYPLQCDPTVQYALALAGRPTQIVHHADLEVNSPYNTYRHAGLPPGPIANPGEASLRAAVSPAKTDFMYFVANDQGGHFFSKTLAEHNRNVTRYRKRLENDSSGANAAPGCSGGPNRHRSPS